MNKIIFPIVVCIVIFMGGNYIISQSERRLQIKRDIQIESNNSISNFVSLATNSINLFSNSKLTTAYIISGAAKASNNVGEDRDREYIFLSTLKDFDFTKYLDMAILADTKMLQALENFSLLYGNSSLGLSQEFKEDLIDLQDVIKENAFFIYNIDEGKLRAKDILRWTQKHDEHIKLTKNILLELQVLERKIK